jgi:hypothetical protein
VVTQNGNKELLDMLSSVDESKDWHEAMELASNLYWAAAAIDTKMKLLICPVCLGTRCTFLTCLLWGVVGSIILGLSITQSIVLICCTPVFVIPFVVWVIAEFL